TPSTEVKAPAASPLLLAPAPALAASKPQARHAPEARTLFEEGTRAPAGGGGDQVAGTSFRSRDERIKELKTLEQKVRHCTRCAELAETRTQTVFGVGNPQARILFLGEAPGADEDTQGEPFVGRAGKLLNDIIAACREKRDNIYICNVLKCRPPGNRTPS